MGARGYFWLKAVIFALLAWNTAVFVHTGTLSEAVDSVAWLVLLALFELETGAAGPRRGSAWVRGARVAAAGAIPLAAIGYVLDREWLDAINSTLWIVVVVILELQVRFPAAAIGFRALGGATLTVLYAGLGTVAAVWLWREDWFSAYDAALWLLAYVTIEINVLQVLRRWPGVAPAMASRTE